MIRERLTAFVLANMLALGTAFIPTAAAKAEDVPSMEYVGEYRVTAFAYYEGGGENYATASGATPMPYYTVATGTEFDFGTILYIDGIGEVEVQDRGAFDEGIIDLHIGYDSMDSFEDKTRAVYIVRR